MDCVSSPSCVGKRCVAWGCSVSTPPPAKHQWTSKRVRGRKEVAEATLLASGNMEPPESAPQVLPRKRARPTRLTDEERKLRQAYRDKMRNPSRICIGTEIYRWTKVKFERGLKSHTDVATVLLDSYEKLQQLMSNPCFGGATCVTDMQLSHDMDKWSDNDTAEELLPQSEEQKVLPAELGCLTPGQESSSLNTGTQVTLPTPKAEGEWFGADHPSDSAPGQCLVNQSDVDAIKSTTPIVSEQTFEKLRIPPECLNSTAFNGIVSHLPNTAEVMDKDGMFHRQAGPANQQTSRSQARAKRTCEKVKETTMSGRGITDQPDGQNPANELREHYYNTLAQEMMGITQPVDEDYDGTPAVVDLERLMEEMPIKKEDVTSESDDQEYSSGEEESTLKKSYKDDSIWLPESLSATAKVKKVAPVRKKKTRVRKDEEVMIEQTDSDAILDIELPIKEKEKSEEKKGEDEGDPDCFSSEEEESGEEDQKKKKEGDDPEWIPGMTSKAQKKKRAPSGDGSSDDSSDDSGDDPSETLSSDGYFDSDTDYTKKKLWLELFPCEICQEYFDSYQSMIVHTISCHPDQYDDKCGICGYGWKEGTRDRVQEVTRHMRETHTLDDFTDPDPTKQNQYVCKHCTFMCKIPLLFVFHIEKCHEKTFFSCVKCEYIVPHRSQIYHHLKSKHEWNSFSPIGKQIKLILRERGYPQVKRESDQKSKKLCILCSEVVRGMTLVKHLQTSHESEIASQEFPCRTCDKTFESYKCLSFHLYFHHKNNKVNCNTCQIKRSSKADINLHIEQMHLGVKHFHCPQCDLYWFRKNVFRRHIDVHEGIRDFLCAFCGKGFKTNYALRVHTRIHTDEKPLKCEFCDYSCRQRNALNWHMKKHKDKVTVKEQGPLPFSNRRNGRPRKQAPLKSQRPGRPIGRPQKLTQ